MRYLKSAEYSQITGRAGRRGIDKVGNVILLANTMSLPNIEEMKNIMANGPERITSKFKFDYNFILKSLNNDNFDFNNFIQNTFLNKDNSIRKKDLLLSLEEINTQIDKLEITTIEQEEYNRIYMLYEKMTNHVKLIKSEKKLKNKYNGELPEKYYLYIDNYYLYEQKTYIEEQIKCVENNMLDIIKDKIDFLKNMNYINDDNKLKIKGILASQVCEIDEILLVELIMSNYFSNMTEANICGIIGSFLNTRCLNEENRAVNEDFLDISEELKHKIQELRKTIDNITENEQKYHLIGERKINFDMIEYCNKWANGYTYGDLYFDNYRGVFNKDILRLDNIIQTMEIICLTIDDKILLNKLENIHSLILRDGVMFESLYIKN